jgi:hypothetical protein
MTRRIPRAASILVPAAAADMVLSAFFGVAQNLSMLSNSDRQHFAFDPAPPPPDGAEIASAVADFRA